MRLPATERLLSAAFLNSIQFSADNPATIDHNSLDHAQLAHAVKTGGPHQFHESDLPKIGVRLRKSGQFSAADIIDNHAKSIQAAKQPPAAPVAQRPNLPKYEGVLSPGRKKAVMAFVNHANPDVQSHVSSHEVHYPGLTSKQAYERAQKAYDTFHAAHMSVPLGDQQPQAVANVPMPGGKRPSLTPQQKNAIARKMGLTVGTPEDDAHFPAHIKAKPSVAYAAAPTPQAPIRAAIDTTKYVPRTEKSNRLQAMEAWAKTPEGKKAYESGGALQPGLDLMQFTERAHAAYDQHHPSSPYATKSPPPAAAPQKQTPAAVAKMHADAVRGGRPVPAEHAERVAKNLAQNGYQAEANRVMSSIAPKRPGNAAQPRSFLNDETTGMPAKLPAATPAEPLPAPKFGYSTHTAPTGVQPGEQQAQPTTHGRFARLLDAAKQGRLKEHIDNGLGNFFQKFEKKAGPVLKKLGIDTGYDDDQNFSRAIANLEEITQEFARKSAPNQMGLFDPSELATAVAPKSKTRSLRKPASGQKSFTWDEDSHPREKDHHDGKKPGEFAPKESGHPATKAEPEDEPEEEKPEENEPPAEDPGTIGTFVAKGHEIYDANGVRHGAFRTPEKAAEAADRWNREGKPGSSPAVKAVEQKFPSLVGYVEPESPREELKKIADEHLASEIPPAQNPVSGAKADAKKEAASTDDQPNYANLPADDGSDPDAPKGDDDEYGPVRDFGEKLGGARKDRAVERGSSAKKEKSSQPAWMKRYLIAPVATGVHAGKYTIIDAKSGRSPLRGIYMDSREQAEKMLPAVEVARKHDVRNVAKQGEPDNWAVIRHVSDRKRPVIKGGFKTSEEATGYMVNNAAEILATNTRITNAIHPAMENVTREGASHRNGKHATESDFEKFGFRGVEFGKWVNQAEGRHILDHAYDSLVDMSEAIGVPAKALSLDGELGLGFGSRGHGNAGWGGAANAHYERGYGAINITKLHGAGSLAHEWMHAVDHWLGRKSGKASDQKILNKHNDDVFKAGEPHEDFVSHGTPRKAKDGFRSEVSAAIEGVRDAIMHRDVKYKEDQSTHEKIQKKRIEALSQQLSEFRESMARDYSKDKYQHYKGKRGLPASPEVMKEIDEISAKLLAGEYGDDVRHGESASDTPANKIKWGHSMPANVARLSDLHKQLRGNKGYTATSSYGGTSLNGIIADIKTAAMMHRTGLANLKEAKEQKEKTGKVRSEFYSHAGKMDQGQKEDYWSTPHEMMARAFESYVYDKIKSKKNRNDFLAYEKHNDLPEYRMFNVKPYPEGDERPKINAAFDHLFSVLSKHEMDGTHRSTVKKVDKDEADTKTWRGYLKATDTAHWISGIESHIKGRDGIVRFAEKKGTPTKSQFFSKPAGTSIEDWEKKIKAENKSGKFFVIKNGEQQFSRASSLDTALSRLTDLSSSLRNAS